MLRNLGVYDAGKQFSGPDGSVFWGPVVTLLSSESYRNDRNWELEISRNAWYSRLHTHTHTHNLCEWKILLALSGNRHSGYSCVFEMQWFSRTMYGVSKSIGITRLGIIVGSIYKGLEKVNFPETLLVVQMVKNPPANSGDLGWIPGSGWSPGEGNDYPFQYSGLKDSMDRGAWQAIGHGVSKESDTTEHAQKEL